MEHWFGSSGCGAGRSIGGSRCGGINICNPDPLAGCTDADANGLSLRWLAVGTMVEMMDCELAAKCCKQKMKSTAAISKFFFILIRIALVEQRAIQESRPDYRKQ